MKAISYSLGEVTELAQDADKSGHGDAFKESLGVILVRGSVQFRISQAELIPYLVPTQRHCSD